MKRIYGDNCQIDKESVHKFYSNRIINIKNHVDNPVVLCGDSNIDNIDEWTNYEIYKWIPFINLDGSCTILEAGCGTGRISKFLVRNCKQFIGFDNVNDFIEIAKKRTINKNAKFINNSFDEILNNTLNATDKFNRFVISGGLLMYINDFNIKNIFSKLVTFFDEKCIIYISEPIAIGKRLTLNNFYSETLNTEYSAIYRTTDEYKELFSVFYQYGFSLKIDEEFFEKDIKMQKETRQWIFIFEKS